MHFTKVKGILSSKNGMNLFRGCTRGCIYCDSRSNCYRMGLTLRDGNREYFYSQLDKKFPKLKERYIREYGNNYVANSGNDKKLMGLFHEFCERNGIVHDNEAIFNHLNLFEGKDISRQLSFFDEV